MLHDSFSFFSVFHIKLRLVQSYFLYLIHSVRIEKEVFNELNSAKVEMLIWKC